MTRLQWLLVHALVCPVLGGCFFQEAVSAGNAHRGPAARAEIVQPESEARQAGTRMSPGEVQPHGPATNPSETITSIGASTATNLVAHAAVEFKRMCPGVTVQVTGSLANMGPPALLEGRADIVPMNRPLTPAEIQAFTAKYGYAPTEIKVAADAVAIYVEKNNPVPGLTWRRSMGFSPGRSAGAVFRSRRGVRPA